MVQSDLNIWPIFVQSADVKLFTVGLLHIHKPKFDLFFRKEMDELR